MDNEGVIIKILITLPEMLNSCGQICTPGKKVIKEDFKYVSRIFRTLGPIEFVTEEDLGPAYSLTQNGLVIVRGN